MTKHNAAAWLLDRHVSSGAAERTALRADGRSVGYAELLREAWRVLLLDDEPAFPAWFAVVAERDGEDLQSPVALVGPRAGHRVTPDAVALYCSTRPPPVGGPEAAGG